MKTVSVDDIRYFSVGSRGPGDMPDRVMHGFLCAWTAAVKTRKTVLDRGSRSDRPRYCVITSIRTFGLDV